jgi:hypothetical protein
MGKKSFFPYPFGIKFQAFETLIWTFFFIVSSSNEHILTF